LADGQIDRRAGLLRAAAAASVEFRLRTPCTTVGSRRRCLRCTRLATAC
jgi:hypothetical protein